MLNDWSCRREEHLRETTSLSLWCSHVWINICWSDFNYLCVNVLYFILYFLLNLIYSWCFCLQMYTHDTILNAIARWTLKINDYHLLSIYKPFSYFVIQIERPILVVVTWSLIFHKHFAKKRNSWFSLNSSEYYYFRIIDSTLIRQEEF